MQALCRCDSMAASSTCFWLQVTGTKWTPTRPLFLQHLPPTKPAPWLQVTARKLSTHVAFPVSHLDMTPFLTHTAVRQRCRVQRHPGGEARGIPGSAGSTLESRSASLLFWRVHNCADWLTEAA